MTLKTPVTGALAPRSSKYRDQWTINNLLQGHWQAPKRESADITGWFPRILIWGAVTGAEEADKRAAGLGVRAF